jgi:GTP cyclohydrolase II
MTRPYRQARLTLPERPAPGDPPDPAVLRVRVVHRAASELRRGTPVLLTGPAPLVVLGAETAGPEGITDFLALGDGSPVLLLAPARAAAVLHRPVEQGVPAIALPLPDGMLLPPALQALADPTMAQSEPSLAETVAPPVLSPAALTLAKLGRLLPAVLALPARQEAAAQAARRSLLSVPGEDISGYQGTEALALRQVAAARVPLDSAPDARVIAFRAEAAANEHLAIIIGNPAAAAAPLVRLHSECFTGDLLGSLRCDCGQQLRGAIRRMAEDGAGVLLYLAQEGRGIGLVNKLRAYALQDRGLDTLDANRALGWGADERNFLLAATMLEALGISRIRLLTNNPDKLAALAACGIEIAGREAHVFAPNGVNDQYLATKARRFGHLLD